MLTTTTGILTIILLIFLMVPPLRLTSIERAIGGLPRAFRIHHLIGVTVPILGAVHAVAAMYPYLSASGSTIDAIRLFFDPSDPAVLLGTASWLFLTSTVATSLWPKVRRTAWLWLHRLSILGFAFALAHIFIPWSHSLFFGERIADAGRLTITSMAIFVAIGLLLHFIWPEALGTHRAFIVKTVDHLSENIAKLTLKLGNGRGVWHSGEFGYFRFDCRGPCGVTRERHPFTVIEMSGLDEMKIIVKAAGDDTTKLQQIEVGTPGVAIGPYGSLEALLSHNEPQLWIAGGLGMMPFLGMAHRIEERGKGASDIALIYLHRPGDKVLFLPELQHIASSHPSLKIEPLEAPSGKEIGLEEIEPIVPDWRSREIGLAGPHDMVDYWTRLLRARGMPQSRIYTEDFSK